MLANEVANRYLLFLEWASFMRGSYGDDWLNIEDEISPVQTAFQNAYDKLYATGHAPTPRWQDAIDLDAERKNFRLTPIPHRQRPKNLGPIG